MRILGLIYRYKVMKVLLTNEIQSAFHNIFWNSDKLPLIDELLKQGQIEIALVYIWILRELFEKLVCKAHQIHYALMLDYTNNKTVIFFIQFLYWATLPFTYIRNEFWQEIK